MRAPGKVACAGGGAVDAGGCGHDVARAHDGNRQALHRRRGLGRRGWGWRCLARLGERRGQRERGTDDEVARSGGTCRAPGLELPTCRCHGFEVQRARWNLPHAMIDAAFSRAPDRASADHVHGHGELDRMVCRARAVGLPSSAACRQRREKYAQHRPHGRGPPFSKDRRSDANGHVALARGEQATSRRPVASRLRARR